MSESPATKEVFRVREVGLGDEAAVAELEAYGPHDFLMAGYRGEFQREEFQMLCLESSNGVIAAFEMVHIIDEHNVIFRALRTHKDFKGLGLAKRMAIACREWVQQRLPAVTHFWSTVRISVDTPDQLSMYDGFVERFRVAFVYLPLRTGIAADVKDPIDLLDLPPPALTRASEEDFLAFSQAHPHFFPHGHLSVQWVPFPLNRASVRVLARNHVFFVSDDGSQPRCVPASLPGDDLAGDRRDGEPPCRPTEHAVAHSACSLGALLPIADGTMWACSIYARGDVRGCQQHMREHMELARQAGAHDLTCFVDFSLADELEQFRVRWFQANVGRTLEQDMYLDIKGCRFLDLVV